MTDERRERYAALFRSPPGVERLGDATPGEIAAAVIAVADAELKSAVLSGSVIQAQQIARLQEENARLREALRNIKSNIQNGGCLGESALIWSIQDIAGKALGE